MRPGNELGQTLLEELPDMAGEGVEHAEGLSELTPLLGPLLR